ncbi:hypothetical protein DRP04_04680 [Archaeoglobales archaeon]|nr:MAG: hypothetical protein DRP04_04680 [Archaeoglobales archaeon]
MEFVRKEDFTEIFNKFIRKNLARSLSKPTEYETSPFRQPELYGLPIFVIGYGGKPISYIGQYIAHKVIKARLNGRIETRWKILTGFVRVIAKHVEEDVYIEIFANGVPSAGVAEWLNNRDKYVLIEDRTELNEIECREEDIVNLSGVMKYEDPVILIDVTGLLRELPADILARYTELVAVYKSFQEQIYNMEQIIDDLKVELDTTKAENRILRTQVHRLNTRIMSVAGTLMHYKSELLKTKELLQFHLERLEAVKEGKERLQAVINDFYDILDAYESTVAEVAEKFAQLEKIGEETERTEKAVSEVKKEKKKKKEGEE